ncbi:uncharacterized protein YutE (UPF0331/DUF86 family) [Lewinella aquimaris]|uniref:Uncharacterized protein YutE (UPF0331/DUF86 family) n=1 Tax=Neolewinella aquimaris TaxID=1835722 RepID=A0A840EH15_9BACT|nr:HEPN domain-containing protein [Neolewinella aquimaris]MBB4081099.1 uncharacterized protein YutE (UPF0331/DUF86 family) [Neolewinella aquimaris]
MKKTDRKSTYTYFFEIIVSAKKDDLYLDSATNLANLLLSNSKLWPKGKLSKNGKVITNNVLYCEIDVIKPSSDNTDETLRFYLSSTSTEFKFIEPYRLKLLEFLNSHQFGNQIFVVQDDVSADIANQLYPKINRLESMLRGYIIKFFMLNFGVNWWNLIADDSMQRKATLRKNNEKDFSKFIDNKIYLIDFAELGKIVYTLSAGSVSKSDIVQTIMQLDETDSGAILNLKESIKSNYDKYFKVDFKDRKFQAKWEELEKLRHKVAHNNLFTQFDLHRCEELYNDLSKIIMDAINKIDKVSFTDQEKDEIIENSIININEYLGSYLKQWQELTDILYTYDRKNLKKEHRGYLSIKSLTDRMLKESLISEDTARAIDGLRQFRNSIVHSPSDADVSEHIQEMKKDLSIVINTIQKAVAKSKEENE